MESLSNLDKALIEKMDITIIVMDLVAHSPKNKEEAKTVILNTLMAYIEKRPVQLLINKLGDEVVKAIILYLLYEYKNDFNGSKFYQFDCILKIL